MEVSFTPPPTIGNQTFNLKARLARRSPDGVGVAFIGTPLEATRTLNKVAASMRTQHMFGKRYQGKDSKQLQETCKSLLTQTVQDAVDAFYGLIDGKLSTTASQLSNFTERNVLMDAIAEIRLHEADDKQGVQQRVLESLEQLFKRKSASEPKRDKAGLSIVQTEEFEDWLNLTAEINKLEARFSEELIALEPRLEKLYGRPLDRSTNPFAPSVIEHAAKAVFEKLSLSTRVRQIYGTMGEALAHALRASKSRTPLASMPLPLQTASAASRIQPPMKTANR